MSGLCARLQDELTRGLQRRAISDGGIAVEQSSTVASAGRKDVVEVLSSKAPCNFGLNSSSLMA